MPRPVPTTSRVLRDAARSRVPCDQGCRVATLCFAAGGGRVGRKGETGRLEDADGELCPDLRCGAWRRCNRK